MKSFKVKKNKYKNDVYFGVQGGVCQNDFFKM